MLKQLCSKWLSLPSPALRFHSIDILRGLAALWVALFHSLPTYAYTYGTSRIGDYVVDMIVNCRGVEMFFVISGYCISCSAFKNRESPVIFLKQRIRRIYPTYWWSVIFGALVVSSIAWSGYGESADWPHLPSILISLPLLANNQI